jgi:hypothetical protein
LRSDVARSNTIPQSKSTVGKPLLEALYIQPVKRQVLIKKIDVFFINFVQSVKIMKISRKRILLSRKLRLEATSDRNNAVLSAKIATSRAIRSSRALDLSIKSINQGNLVELQPDGKVVILKKIDKIKPKKDGLVKGMSICLK